MASIPSISVVILNYNGARWMDRCLSSLGCQSLLSQMEVIIADNKSSDGSDLIAEKLLSSWPNGLFIQHGENLGYCEGNNRAAAHAKGEFLLFLNNDTWLEPDCIEVLLREVKKSGAAAANPLVLNYGDDTFQSLGARGFDLFGLSTNRLPFENTEEVFMPEGCAYLIARDVFQKLGGFDPELFMFSDELDLSWRLWIAGYRAVGAPSARLHHRGAANVNPKGGGQVAELRTSDTKRFYANRNGLLVLLKNCRHVLLVLPFFQLMLLAVEAAVGWILVRRWSFVRRAYVDAIADCWRLRGHILRERKRLKRLRVRSDWWMLRFLKLRLNRWDELCRMVRYGPPKVTDQ
jgi:GT2 family glycosyltransferase